MVQDSLTMPLNTLEHGLQLKVCNDQVIETCENRQLHQNRADIVVFGCQKMGFLQSSLTESRFGVGVLGGVGRGHLYEGTC